MAKKLIDFYTPLKSHQLLRHRFKPFPAVVNLINKMPRTVKCVFAALCDGMTVTTAGYNIPADFVVNRASAVIHTLRELNFPIESKYAPALSDTGGVTRQSIFYIERSVLLRLNAQPEKVLKEFEKARRERKWALTQTELKRMIEEYGKGKLIKAIERIEQEEKEAKKNKRKKKV